MSYKDRITLNVKQIVVLVANLYNSADDPDVGNEDTDMLLWEILKPLEDVRAKVPRGAIERALWACNMNDEAGKFWYPTTATRGRTFKDFLKQTFYKYRGVGSCTFNEIYHWIRDEESEK